MRLLRFIHEQITNPAASTETVNDQPLKDSDGKQEPSDDNERTCAHAPNTKN